MTWWCGDSPRWLSASRLGSPTSNSDETAGDDLLRVDRFGSIVEQLSVVPTGSLLNDLVAGPGGILVWDLNSRDDTYGLTLVGADGRVHERLDRSRADPWFIRSALALADGALAFGAIHGDGVTSWVSLVRAPAGGLESNDCGPLLTPQSLPTEEAG